MIPPDITPDSARIAAAREFDNRISIVFSGSTPASLTIT